MFFVIYYLEQVDYEGMKGKVKVAMDIAEKMKGVVFF